MQFFPDSIRKLIEHFDALPGIGPKHATRLALHLLNRKGEAQKFARDVATAADGTYFCGECQNITDQSTCIICRDPHRSHTTVCVVAHVQDIEPIERTGKFNGVYHVLHGMIDPLEGITPDHIKIKELMGRLQRNGVDEVILALDATSEGEATTLYLAKLLKDAPVKVTKLARGLPMGSSIEYADEVTLSSAIENRK